ncbi:hypothetical protein SAMN05216311_103128 [Chitinophaga sp. CF418]|nr:hypothetical protein SAMN05216311_103128 [Chitinophaga sp. CF418]
MRYSRYVPSLFPLENYTTQLKKIMDEQPASLAQKTLEQLIQRERSISYEMIARFVPMETTAEMLTFLQAFIAEEKNGEDIITEDGENAVEKITMAFLERGKELINIGNCIIAAEIAFAIILAIEPELCLVYDEGWTYQMIIIDTFGFLNQIGNQQLSDNVFDSLSKTASQHFNSIPEEDRYYDDKWEEIISTFRNRSIH